MKKISISSSLEEVLENRDKVGFRYDNTSYWKAYYKDKLKNLDVSREKRYAKFIHSYVKKTECYCLDVATGYGFLPVEMQKLGIRVVCSDLFENMSELAAEYFKKNKQRYEYKKSDISDLPFKDNTFDVLTAMSIIEHFPKKEVIDDILPELYRVIKKDGLLFVHVPVKSLSTLMIKFFRKYVKNELMSWANDEDNDVTHRIWMWTNEYKQMLEKAGFKVEYQSFNFIRSNEKHGVVKMWNRLIPRSWQEFYPEKSLLARWIIPLFSTSSAFVCKKGI